MRAFSVATVVCAGALVQAPSVPPDGRTRLLILPQHDLRGARTGSASVGLSADGLFIAFASFARLVPADADDRSDVYILNRTTGAVTLESIATEQLALDGDCSHPRLSADGRYLVFEAALLAGHEMPVSTIVLRDRAAGVSKYASRNLTGLVPRARSSQPAISGDGQLVAFTSTATDLVAGPDANGSLPDVYLYRAATERIVRISVDARGVQAAYGQSVNPRLSEDGRFVAFLSSANLGTGAGHDARRESSVRPRSEPYQVYVLDILRDSVRQISMPRGGGEPDGISIDPAISGDGRFIAFTSYATNLVPADRNRSSDVFVYDLVAADLTMISRSAAGGSGNGHSGAPALSSDGRFVAFHSEASDLVCTRRCPPEQEDVNLVSDVFLADRVARTLTRISAAREGWMEESAAPALDAAGTVVAFSSRHPIDARDVAHDFDLFVYLASGPSAPAALLRR